MKYIKITFSLILVIILLLSNSVFTLAEETDGSVNYIQQLDNIVEKAIKKTNTPGISIAITSPNGSYIKNYGYSNVELEETVTDDTLFELGSMSKSFTGLGILYLEQAGLLSLSDNIKEYIPWLTLNYSGNYKGQKINGEVPVTIANVLYQTTGVPFKTIGDIPEGNSEDMLEQTVKTLDNIYLDFYPGTRHSYATLNYDILGLIIQEVSGQSYEDFIKEKILIPLDLNDTYLFRESAQATQRFSVGYKQEFLSISEYDAPVYRGNTPAGYIISSSNDMIKWMNIQMGLADIPENFKQLIIKSHQGDSTVPSSGSNYYAAGWNVNIKGEGFSHGGSNPNFSSNLVIDTEKEIGICILTNLNSNVPEFITNNFFNVIYNRDIVKYESDTYKNLDTIFTIVFFGACVLVCMYFVLLIKAIIDIIRKKRIREKFKGANVAGILLALPIMIFFGFCVYYLPNILLQRLPWEAVVVWGSKSIIMGCFLGFLAGIIFFSYVVLTFNFIKPKEKNYVALIPLSIINGLTSALIIFTINESFNRNLEYSKELLVYFIFSLAFFIYTLKLVQGRMIVITNDIAYEKRISMIDKVINSSYQAIEKIGAPRIYNGIDGDAGVYSNIPGMVINFASSILTLIFCISYLLSDSLAGFIAAIGVIIVNCVINIITSRIGARYWEKNRDISDVYFGQMTDLVYGFKELVINKLRKFAFWQDITKYSKLSNKLSKESSIKFLNYGLYNHLMYNVVFGVVVFIFPLFLAGIDSNGLRQTLFMVFYLMGPVGNVVGIIPQITGMRINIKRLNDLIADLEDVSTGYSEQQSSLGELPEKITLKLENTIFSYTVEDEETEAESIEFTLGPINTEISTGEITFITGGNGSGKSTLGKIITGLYSPDKGNIYLNDKACNMVELNECFAAVYSDFFLFKKLYGVDFPEKEEETRELLKLMKIDKKVSVNEKGEFESLNLSTGQRKRLAYVVCCLDDKPFMLFDEWAAEQDPEFRQYFYEELLPSLKAKGKGVVVITHDDRFFNLADKTIKLERGEVVE